MYIINNLFPLCLSYCKSFCGYYLTLTVFCFVSGAVVSNLEDDILNNNISIYPYFEFNVPRNVTTTVGQTAFLHCRVEQLGDKAVSKTKLIFNSA